MADHAELIAELPQVEKMTTQERLKHARKRRLQQLKKWSQREKDKRNNRPESNMKKKNGCQIHFVPSVMMLEAAARGDVVEVQRLLMLGVDPDSTNEDGLTALHQCCIDNNEEMMKLLIEFGANVNAEDSERWTPLHAAATCGHQVLVKYLISKGANLLAVNADGNMPYDICEDETTLDYIESEMSRRGVTQELIDETRGAVEKAMLKDMRWLAQQNGDLEYRDSQGATPLHIASANGYLSVVDFLLEHNVAMDVVDVDEWQPIHAAACWGHLDVLETLIRYGATLDAKTKNGETPFDICEDIEMKERIEQLKSELEIKKLTQTQRLRRSQSQNTRSQSVRRTSIRDKTHMTRKEALDEAKMRLEHQGIEDIVKPQQDIDKENGGIENTTARFDHINTTVNGKPKKVMPVAPFSIHSDSQLNSLELKKDHVPPETLISSKNLDEVASKATNRYKESNELIKDGDSSVKQNSAAQPIGGSNGSDSIKKSTVPSSSSSSNQPRHDATLGQSNHSTVDSGNGSYPLMNNGAVITNGQNGHGSMSLAELKQKRRTQRSGSSNNKTQEPVGTTELPAESTVILNGHRASDHKKERVSGVTSTDEMEGSKHKLNCCTIV